MPLAQRLALALVAVAVGTFVLLAAFEVIPGTLYAPHWVVALAGCFFIFGAAMIVRGESGGSVLGPLISCGFMCALAAVINWAAFVAARWGIHTGGLASNTPVGLLPLRITALALDVLAIVMIVDVVRATALRVRRHRTIV